MGLQSRTRTCTLCRGPFVVPSPAMVHPADSVCNCCVLDLCSSPETDEAMAERLAARVPVELGIDPRYVAAGIVRRLRALQAETLDHEELIRVLSLRDPGWLAPGPGPVPEA